MAASVSSVGPPIVGPGNSAPTIYRRQPVNKEPLSGNTLCHKVWELMSYDTHNVTQAAVFQTMSVLFVRSLAKFW